MILENLEKPHEQVLESYFGPVRTLFFHKRCDALYNLRVLICSCTSVISRFSLFCDALQPRVTFQISFKYSGLEGSAIKSRDKRWLSSVFHLDKTRKSQLHQCQYISQVSWQRNVGCLLCFTKTKHGSHSCNQCQYISQVSWQRNVGCLLCFT